LRTEETVEMDRSTEAGLLATCRVRRSRLSISRKIAQDPFQVPIETDNRLASAAIYLLLFSEHAGFCEVTESLVTIERLGGVRI
jgi:hypothetical protein